MRVVNSVMSHSHLARSGFLQLFRSLPILSVFLLTLPLASCRDSTTQASAPPAVPVKSQIVQPGTVVESSQFVGTLESAAEVDLRPETQGRIVKVLVQPGDRVNPGTLILTIQPGQTVPQLQSAQAGVNAAPANQQAMVDQLRMAEKNLEVARTE